MKSGAAEVDPRGLMREAYRMDIGPAEARSIFLDWAIGLPDEDAGAAIDRLLATLGAAHPEHPMTAVLREGRERGPATARRRGGRRRDASDPTTG